MICTLSAAARQLGIDRRTVQRYVRRFPEIMDGNKVELYSLKNRIALYKAGEGRGFPLGKVRGRRLPLKGVPKKPPAIIRRTFVQRLEIIEREIKHMNDEEQQTLLPYKLLSLFRFYNLALALKRDEEREQNSNMSPPHADTPS